VGEFKFKVMKYILFLFLLICNSDYLLAQDMTPPGCAPVITPPEKKAEGIITQFDTAKSASFPGGLKDLDIFIRENSQFPEAAKVAGILSADIIISFVVEKDGTLTDIQICRDIGYGLGEEAVRIVRQMPKWHPGEVNGHPCRIWMNLPIRLRSPEK
jgi:protein TonB